MKAGRVALQVAFERADEERGTRRQQGWQVAHEHSVGTQGSGTSPLPADLKAGLETHRGDPRSHCIAVVCGEGDIARWARSGGPDGENDRTSWTVQLPSMLYSPQLGAECVSHLLPQCGGLSSLPPGALLSPVGLP